MCQGCRLPSDMSHFALCKTLNSFRFTCISDFLFARRVCWYASAEKNRLGAWSWTNWWRWGESNSWPPACKAGALPAELHPQISLHTSSSAPRYTHVLSSSRFLVWNEITSLETILFDKYVLIWFLPFCLRMSATAEYVFPWRSPTLLFSKTIFNRHSAKQKSNVELLQHICRDFFNMNVEKTLWWA